MSEPLVFTFTTANKEGKLKKHYVGGFNRLPSLRPEKGDAR